MNDLLVNDDLHIDFLLFQQLVFYNVTMDILEDIEDSLGEAKSRSVLNKMILLPLTGSNKSTILDMYMMQSDRS